MTSKTLGEFIREMRTKLNISLRELGRRLKVSAAFLSDIELGRRFPSEGRVKSLAKEFNISVAQLKEFDDRELLKDFKRLIESSYNLRAAFRSTMKEVRSGKLSPDELAIKLAANRE